MRSDNVTKGAERAPNRSLFYALGYTQADLEKPLIAVVSAHSDIVPGHMNLDKLADAVKAGVDSFLAKPLFASNVMEEFRQAVKKKNIESIQKKRKAELKGRRILLAEDVAINAEIVMMLLSMKEVETDHALNGKIAVEKFAEHPENYYDAILMDIRMPEMDGLTAAAKIRAMDRADARTIPIAALTANAFDEDVQRSLQAGMNVHLSKPTDPEQLYSALESLIWEKENKEK